MTILNKKNLLRPSVIIGCVIIAAWLVTMAVLLKDYGAAPEAAPANTDQQGLFGSVQTAEKWQDIDEWMLLVRADAETGKTSPVGASHTSIRRLDKGTSSSAFLADFAISAKLSPLLPAGNIAGSAALDKDGNLTSFTAQADIAGFILSSQGLIADEKLFVKIIKPNGINRFIKTLRQPVTFGEVLRPSLTRHLKLEPGQTMSSPVLDPLTGKNRGSIKLTVQKQEKISLNGRAVSAFRIKTSLADVESLMWVDKDGRTLRRNLVNSLRMDRTDAATARKIAPGLEKSPALPVLDLQEFSDIPVDAPAAADEVPGGTAGVLDFILK